MVLRFHLKMVLYYQQNKQNMFLVHIQLVTKDQTLIVGQETKILMMQLMMLEGGQIKQICVQHSCNLISSLYKALFNLNIFLQVIVGTQDVLGDVKMGQCSLLG